MNGGGARGGGADRHGSAALGDGGGGVHRRPVDVEPKDAAGAATPGDDVDLDLCAREPIHVPGAIQPQGYLFAIDEELCIDVVSTNVAELLDRRPGEVLGADLTSLLGGTVYDLVGESRLRDGRPTHGARVVIGGRPCEAFAHVSIDRRTIVEIECSPAREEAEGDLLDRVETDGERVLAEESFEHVTTRLAESVRRLTGFDRVVVYRFDDSWSGEVVAEDGSPEMERYLGLRFPASDIPPQARRLYELSPVRVIFDARSAPSPLLAARPGEGPLDLSRSVLRAVSPVHVRYLENMRVRSSMSVSLMHEGRLWGLVACHGRGPAQPSGRVRRAASMLGRLVMPHVAELDPRRGGRRRSQSGRHLDALVQALSIDRDPLRILADPDHGALPLVPAGGVAVRIGGRVRSCGAVPEARELESLLDHLDATIQSGVLADERLAESWPPAATLGATAAGVLGIRIGRTRGDVLAWLRPEQPRVVQWAGDPRKPAAWDAGGVSRLQPRESFAAWREELRGRSEPWLAWELDVAQRVRGVLVNIVDRYDAFDSEQGRRRRAEDDLARARTDLVRQRRAVLAMLADAAETGEDRERLREVVAGLAPMVDRLARAMGRHEDMAEIEERLAGLERMVSDPRDTQAPARVRELRERFAGLVRDSSPEMGSRAAREDDELHGLEAVMAALPEDAPVTVRRHGDGRLELRFDRRLAGDELERVRHAVDEDPAHGMSVEDRGGGSVVMLRPIGAG